MKVYTVGSDKAERYLDRVASRRDRLLTTSVRSKARSIVAEIRKKGDAALLKHIRQHDLGDLAGTEIRLDLGPADGGDVPEELRRALDASVNAVTRFHRPQVSEGYTIERDGSLASLRLRPLPSVGVVLPGTHYAHLAALTMAVVPAQLAGVGRIAVAVSPRAYLASAAIRYLLRRLEVDEVYLMGGVHAIAALAYGTESVEPVSMIVARGGALTTAAKLEVAADVQVDLRGGITEQVIVADARADADMVAADLVAQVEHDPDALGVVVTTTAKLADAVNRKVRSRLRRLRRGHEAKAALRTWGAILVAGDEDEAARIVNRIAPSRVELLVEDPLHLADGIDAAALVALGPWSPSTLVDVSSGVNHIVPTFGASDAAGPLTVWDFYRPSCLVQLAAHHFPKLQAFAATIAEADGLPLHVASLTAGERGRR